MENYLNAIREEINVERLDLIIFSTIYEYENQCMCVGMFCEKLLAIDPINIKIWENYFIRPRKRLTLTYCACETFFHIMYRIDNLIILILNNIQNLKKLNVCIKFQYYFRACLKNFI